MFNGNIFVSHLFCLVFCMDQNIVQVLADICLSAAIFSQFWTACSEFCVNLLIFMVIPPYGVSLADMEPRLVFVF